MVRGPVVLDRHVRGSVDGRAAASVDSDAASARSAVHSLAAGLTATRAGSAITASAAGGERSADVRASDAARANAARADAARADATGPAHVATCAGDNAARTSAAASA